MIERRTFVRSLALAAAASTVLGRSKLGAIDLSSLLPYAPRTVSDPYRYAGFARLEGTGFRVSDEGAPDHWLTLDAAVLVPRDARFENFSLRFLGAADVPLADQIHRFHHQELGSFDLFTTRGREETGRQSYHAVIYRFA